MKKLFLLILAGGMMMTACKKEEKMNVAQQNLHLKDHGIQSNTTPPQDTLPYYYLAEANVWIDSVLCNKFVSSINPSSIIYIPVTENKSLFRRFKWDAYIQYGQIQCSGAAVKECYNKADGSVVVKRDAHIEIYY